jgi:hypothetical protein
LTNRAASTWARTRPTPEAQRKIVFSGNDAQILKEAARTFRLRQPKPDVTLFGAVYNYKLKRDQDEVEGSVTLKTIVDDKPNRSPPFSIRRTTTSR